jgi:hypothetical protein
MCTKSEYERWGKDLWFDMDSDEFIPAGWTDELIKEVRDKFNDGYGYHSDIPWDELDKEAQELELAEYYWSICKNESEWLDKRELETFYEEYTSPSGDEIVVFGRYGYDG